MNQLIAILNLASTALPAILPAAELAAAALAPDNPQPISQKQAGDVLNALTTAAETAPVLAPVVPLVAKGFAGEPFNDADLDTLRTAADGLDAMVADAVSKD